MRPNIVLFISDDHSWHDSGPYGAPVVQTPSLDRLAADGMRFDRAYSASPTCTPSRCSLYTGLYPFRHGAHPNHSWIREGIETWPSYFQRLGYRVVLAGKTHIGPREQFPFEYLPHTNVMPPGKDAVLWTDLNTSVIDDLLRSHDQTTPLCLIVASHSPHVYWETAGIYDPATVDLPAYLLDTPETREVRAKYYADVQHLDDQVGDVMRSLDVYGYTDTTLMLYTTDHGAQWPFAKWTLYDAGVRVPLIARWPGRVPGASATNALVSLVDLLPTVLHAAQGSEHPHFDGKSFLSVLDGTTQHHQAYVFSTNTGDGSMNQSPARSICDGRFKLILNLTPEVPFKTHIDAGEAVDGLTYWRSWERLANNDEHARQRLDHYRFRPDEELYDLREDPCELRNLIGDPAFKAELNRLRDRLRQWRIEQGEDLATVATSADARTGPLPYAS